MQTALYVNYYHMQSYDQIPTAVYVNYHQIQMQSSVKYQHSIIHESETFTQIIE